MQLVFNSPLIYIVDYPQQNAVEVVDRRLNAGTLMRDGAADRFRRDFSELMSHEPSMEDVEEFIDGYEVEFNQTTLMH